MITVSDIELKLRGFKIEPQSKEQALANLNQFKVEFGLIGSEKVNKERLKEIVKRAGSFSDEVIATRKSERD